MCVRVCACVCACACVCVCVCVWLRVCDLLRPMEQRRLGHGWNRCTPPFIRSWHASVNVSRYAPALAVTAHTDTHNQTDTQIHAIRQTHRYTLSDRHTYTDTHFQLETHRHTGTGTRERMSGGRHCARTASVDGAFTQKVHLPRLLPGGQSAERGEHCARTRTTE